MTFIMLLLIKMRKSSPNTRFRKLCLRSIL